MQRNEYQNKWFLENIPLIKEYGQPPKFSDGLLETNTGLEGKAVAMLVTPRNSLSL